VLIPREQNDRLLGCRRVVEANAMSDDELLEACRRLISRMQRMVARCYAHGLIPNGPELLDD
jgi:hypothetical protein